MSSISDIQTAAAKSEPNLASFDAIDINQVTSVTELIALSQIYQYAAEHAAITGESSTVDVVGRCTARVCAIAARLCDVYGARQDVDSCIRALEHLRSIEYGYGLDDISSFVDKQVGILRRSSLLSPAHKLMLALIDDADNEEVSRLVAAVAAQRFDAFGVRSMLTAYAIDRDVQIPIAEIRRWLETEIHMVSILPLDSERLHLMDLVPLAWNYIPALRPVLESLAVRSAADDNAYVNIAVSALQAFLSLNSLIAEITAA